MAAVVNAAVATERAKIVASVIRATGDWDLAEDCVQDAVERALDRWPRDGIPDNPAAWLVTTARRRAIDVIRRRQTESDKLRQIDAPTVTELDLESGDGPYEDDRLKMLFACCHPALPLAGRVALTLKTVAGLSTREIARAFLTSEATMGQRLLRTRAKIEHTGISFRVPEPNRLDERISGVLAVVYLVFNEGYAATEGDYLRPDLAAEALQLGGLLAELLPDDDEVQGLLALMRFQHSRRVARVDAAGDLLPPDEQDRSRWDRRLIDVGTAALNTARASGRVPGYYRLQAEIAALHATAPTAELTDWPRIVTAYDALATLRPSPVIALNRAVAVSFADGPDAGLVALGAIDDGMPMLDAARADMLRRAGRHDESAVAYVAAIEQAGTEAERRFLRRRLGEVQGT